MGDLSFKFCPVCGGELQSGKLRVPSERTVYSMQYCSWYSEKDMNWMNEHPLKAAFVNRQPIKTVVSKKPCIPSGYCSNCNKIFAELEIRGWGDPIE